MQFCKVLWWLTHMQGEKQWLWTRAAQNDQNIANVHIAYGNCNSFTLCSKSYV